MAHSALIDGTAYEIKGGKCLVDGTEYSIKRGIGLVEGTQVEYDFTVEPSLVINSKSDWDNFVQNSATFSSGDLVRLNTNLDLLGDQYNSIEFSGNFDGGSNTIENGTFNQIFKENDEYQYVCGMFATLSNGQIIANVRLKNIICNSISSNDTISGFLAGCTYGSTGKKILIQNVHVENGNIYGWETGGIVGIAKNVTIIYCSSKNVTTSNWYSHGGIVGETDGSVENCFSTYIYGNKDSCYGIVSKLKGNGTCRYCWCFEIPYWEIDETAHMETVNKVDASYNFRNMVILGYRDACWETSRELPMDFNKDYITYKFKDGE